jgi:hypothetical protein
MKRKRNEKERKRDKEIKKEKNPGKYREKSSRGVSGDRYVH